MAAHTRANGHALGPDAFVHLDVISAFSRLQSPSTPQDYVSALVQQFPLNQQSASAPRPALALCDWGLQSSVKMAGGLRPRRRGPSAGPPAAGCSGGLLASLGGAAARAPATDRRRRGVAVASGA